MNNSKYPTYEISIEMLAQLRVLMQSGTSLENIAEILDAGKMASVGQNPSIRQSDSSQPKAATYDLSQLKANTQHLKATVDALLASDDVKDLPAIAGSLDLISHATAAVLGEMELLDSTAAGHRKDAETGHRPNRSDDTILAKIQPESAVKVARAKSEIADAPSPHSLPPAGSQKPPAAARLAPVYATADSAISLPGSAQIMAAKPPVPPSIPSGVRPHEQSPEPSSKPAAAAPKVAIPPHLPVTAPVAPAARTRHDQPTGKPLEPAKKPVVPAGSDLHNRLAGVLDQISSLARDSGANQDRNQ